MYKKKYLSIQGKNGFHYGVGVVVGVVVPPVGVGVLVGVILVAVVGLGVAVGAFVGAFVAVALGVSVGVAVSVGFGIGVGVTKIILIASSSGTGERIFLLETRIPTTIATNTKTPIITVTAASVFLRSSILGLSIAQSI